MASPASEVKGLVGNAGLLDLEAHDSNLLSDVRHTLRVWLQGCSVCPCKTASKSLARLALWSDVRHTLWLSGG